MCATWSPETTWIPLKHPHEIVSREEGDALVKEINLRLSKLCTIGRVMVAKLDPHHGVYGLNQTHCVEVVPFYQPFQTWWLINDSEWPSFRWEINQLFKLMRGFGLVPSHMTRRGGVETHWPGGGCHIHYGADLFSVHNGVKWYDLMKRFHQNLSVDYANRPYIRWLFSNWFADAGSHVLTKPARLTRNQVFEKSFECSAIYARWMGCSKTTYPTFEFRMFSMIEDADELKAIALFVHNWVDSLVTITLRDENIPFKLTSAKWQDFQDLRKSRRICEEMLDNLELDWHAGYSEFYDRNYTRRIKFGEFN